VDENAGTRTEIEITGDLFTAGRSVVTWKALIELNGRSREPIR